MKLLVGLLAALLVTTVLRQTGYLTKSQTLGARASCPAFPKSATGSEAAFAQLFADELTSLGALSHPNQHQRAQNAFFVSYLLDSQSIFG